jgi:hypothetical protein
MSVVSTTVMIIAAIMMFTPATPDTVVPGTPGTPGREYPCN